LFQEVVTDADERPAQENERRSVGKRVDDLKSALFAANHGRDACNAINKLSKQAEKGNELASNVLALYAAEGSINHMRAHACACLARSLKQPDAQFIRLFQKGLSDPELRYWSIVGYLNSVGKMAYEDLTKIAEDASVPVEVRAQAIKCLAKFSKQSFDRDLPSDPGHWKAADLRVSELRAWATDGYQDGEGYSPPMRHPALDSPSTAFEKIVSRLDRKLDKERQARQDLADPTNWLEIPALEDMQRIKTRWDLPSTYLDFLTSFSPIEVTIQSRKFYNGLQLFGASELIEAQDGYSFNPIERQPIEDWPAHLVVIASHGGDPYVLDLSKSDGEDAPVDTAEHGAGVWKFHRVADSFCAFMEQLGKQKR
jgi:SMI1 / KNR4 family (SUKH-1)